MMEACIHCGKQTTTGYLHHHRRLCYSCHADKAIRNQYPTRNVAKNGEECHEPTMEEVEATIAEVIAEGLPDWWDKESHKSRPKGYRV